MTVGIMTVKGHKSDLDAIRSEKGTGFIFEDCIVWENSTSKINKIIVIQKMGTKKKNMQKILDQSHI